MTEAAAIKRGRIGIFLPSLDGGGAEKIMLALSSEIAKRAHFVELIVASDRGQLANHVPNNVRLVSFGVGKTVRAVPALLEHLRRARLDCLLSTVLNANITALLARRLAGTSTRCVICEANPTEFDARASSATKTWLNRVAIRLLYPRADAVIAISNGVRDSLIRYAKVEPKRIHLIPNPLLKECSTAEDAHDSLLKDEGAPRIVACGRLQPQKDHLTLLRGFALLRAQMRARLLILGEGPLLEPLKAETHRLGIAGDVEFLGFHFYPQQVMRTAKVFAHTSRWEGFGIVLLEALANGCIVVATDCPGGVRDALDNGKYGLLVPMADPAALAAALEKALTGQFVPPDPTRHLERFDLKHVTDRYLSVLLRSSARC